MTDPADDLRAALLALGQARAKWKAAQHARRHSPPSLALLNAEDEADAMELRARCVVLAIADSLASATDTTSGTGRGEGT